MFAVANDVFECGFGAVGGEIGNLGFECADIRRGGIDDVDAKLVNALFSRQ